MLCRVWTQDINLFLLPKIDTGLRINFKSTGFANFIDEWSQCDFCFINFGVILEYLESSITTKKAIFRLSSTWSWHVYTIVRDTRSSCGGPLTWKAQIHDGSHRVNFDRNLPPSCFAVRYHSLISKISGVKVTPSITSVESSEQFWHEIRQIWRICEPEINFKFPSNA